MLEDELNKAVNAGGAEHIGDHLENLQTTGPGTRFRLSDGTRWIYQSPWRGKVGRRARRAVGRCRARGRARTLVVGGRPVRVLTAPASVADTLWADRDRCADRRILRSARSTLPGRLFSCRPLVLLVASAGGYWMSRRALEPVDRITRTARAISAENLAERLPLRGADDELDRLSDTLNDMFARLDAAFRRVTQFTADASHELRTPVAIIRTTAELTRRRPRTEAEYIEALDRILAESERTSRLIDDLLLLARTDAEGEEFAFEPMDLAESLREACEEGRVLAEVAGLSFAARREVRLSGARRSSSAAASVPDPARQRREVHALRRHCPRDDGRAASRTR